MFDMFKREKVVVPDWAAVLDKKNYPQFIAAVESYFNNIGEPYSIEDGAVHLTEKEKQYGLTNLVQICAQINPSDYTELINNHFNSMFETEAFMRSLNLDDFESMRQHIGVRLYSREYLSYMDESVVIARPFAGEMSKVLILDFPQVIQNVHPDNVAAWGRTEEELFDIGSENIRLNYSFEPEELNLGESATFAIETEHPFSSNILLDLDRHPEFVGKGGAIIGIPTRNMSLICPIRDLKIMNALQVFFDFVPMAFSRGPGSLTQEIYWYHSGQFEPLIYHVDEPGKNASFMPSDEFMALLNGGLE